MKATEPGPRAAAGFEARILKLVGGARERRAIASGQVDAVIDPASGSVILLPNAQAALLEHKARFRSLVELASDGYWEQDERYRFVSHTGVAIGSERGGEGILGRTLWELSFDNDGEIDWPTHRTQLQWRAIFRDLEFRCVDRTGALRFIAISGEPRFDPQGRFAGYRGITRDVTAHRQGQILQWRESEDILRRAEARLRRLLELSTDWVWELDTQFRFTRIVGTGMAGVGNILGKTLWELPAVVLGDEEWVRHKSELAAQWSFCDFEYAVQGAGQLSYYSISGEPLYDDAGALTGFHGTGTDITRRRRAAAARV